MDASSRMDGDLPPYLSVSQITTYLQCPRKYRFRYVERREPESRAVELAFGSAVHASIAWWVSERAAGREPTVDALARIVRVDWSSEVNAGDLVFDKQSAEDLGAKAEVLVRLFVERFRSETLLGAEVGFDVELWDPIAHRPLAVPLKGFLDIETPDGFIELKTCARKSSWLNWSLQLGAYSYALRERMGRRPTVRVVELLRKASPAMSIEDAPVADRDEAWFLEVAAEVFASLRRGAFHPTPSFLCGRCEYRRACRT